MFWNKEKDQKQAEDKEIDGVTSQFTNILEEEPFQDQNIDELRNRAETRALDLDLNKFPKELSCMTALDELMQCMSLGGQVRNYYRYGDLTLCDKQNEKLNFCFSQSMKTGVEREQNIQEFYKKRLVEELQRGSSEDIWESKN